MTIVTLGAALIAVAAAIAFIVIRAGTPEQSVASMLRRDDTAGEGR